MRLNLGCGNDRREGYVNVDLRPECADFVSDVTDLNVADGSAEEVLALDILEHFPASRTHAVLVEWKRVLSPDGVLILRVPNLDELSRLVLADPNHARLYIRNLYGGHRFGPEGSWDAHHTGWTPVTLTEDLAGAGFRVLSNDRAVNMTVEARPR